MELRAVDLKLSWDLAPRRPGTPDFRRTLRCRLGFFGLMGGGASSSFVVQFRASEEKFSKYRSSARIPFSSPLEGAWEALMAENSETNSVLLDLSRFGNCSCLVCVRCWKL